MNEISCHISLVELCQGEGIQREVIVDVVEYGIAKPVSGKDSSDWVFDTRSVHWIKKAIRLSQDLEIDWLAVSMVVDLLQQKQALEHKNRQLQRRLQRFIVEHGSDTP